MNRNYSTSPTIYQGALKTPYASPQRPKFASCDRLPPAPAAPRRTWINFFEDLVIFFIGIVITVIIIELVLQIIGYGFSRAPTVRPNLPGLNTRTHYDTLEIKHDADQDAITAAWHLKENILHPDVVGNTEESREAYYRIQLAYVELSDPLARCYHDQYHGLIQQRFGRDDPCPEILVKPARETRRKDNTYGKTNSDQADRAQMSWAENGEHMYEEIHRRILESRERKEREYRAKRTVMMAMDQAKKKQQVLEGSLVEKLKNIAKWIAAWLFTALGFLLGLIWLLIEYIGGQLWNIVQWIAGWLFIALGLLLGLIELLIEYIGELAKR